jgi:hypothetical protein
MTEAPAAINTAWANSKRKVLFIFPLGKGAGVGVIRLMREMTFWLT